MKCHMRLLTVVVLGVSGASTINAADYGYGSGPWPPGAGSENEYNSRYYGSGSERDRNFAPWGGAPYDRLSAGNPPPPNPWDRGNGGDRGGYGMGYSGPNYGGPSYGSGSNYYNGAPSQRDAAGYGYHDERTPNYSWGDRGPGSRSTYDDRPAYGRYGVNPDAERTRPNYAYPQNDGGRGSSPPPMGRQDWGDARRGDPRGGYNAADSDAQPPWERWDNSKGSASGSGSGSGYGYGSGYAEARRGYGSSATGGNTPQRNDDRSAGFDAERSSQTSTANTRDASEWGFPVESDRGGLIPSPSGGPPAGTTDQELDKFSGEPEKNK